MSKKEIEDLCSQAGFKIEAYEIVHVPWTFESEEQAKEFLHTIHNASCSPEESFEHAKKYLNFWKENDLYYLDWELFYLIAVKK